MYVAFVTVESSAAIIDLQVGTVCKREDLS